MLFDIEPVV